MLFVVALIGVIASIAIPGLMRARGAAQAASALGSLRVINSAELSFAITCGLGYYSPDLPSLGLVPPGSPEAFLPLELSGGYTFIRSGYNFSLAGTPVPSAPPSCNGMAEGQTSPGYAAVADPLDATGSTPRFFGTNSDGLIYQHTGTLAFTMPESSSPPAGQPLQ
jgi:type II secretory pathway pseudopilin PulG